MNKYLFSVAAIAGFCFSTPLLAQDAPTGVRSEVPIHQTTLSDKVRRYSIPIKVGSTTIEAALDTGSTGLRVLPGTLADGDTKGGPPDNYGYGAGTEFRGEAGSGTLTIGSASGTSTLQVIDALDCNFDMPHCPVTRIPAGKFGVEGDGLPGEGFRAIIGMNMGKADVASPLPAIGVRRWIIELPRADSDTGKLILNPTDDEVKGFAIMPVISDYSDQRGGLHDSVVGCLLNDKNNDKACGALLMDSGAPGIVLANSPLVNIKPWDNGTPATLAFYSNKSGLAATEQIIIGSYGHSAHLSYISTPGGVVSITGLTPYLAFDVLYDSGQDMIGLNPRPAAPGAPAGSLVSGQGGK